MKKRALSFIEIPERSRKPRRDGLTIARDYGIGYCEAKDWMESVGDYIDYIKIRHFFVLTAREDEQDLTMRKIKLYKENGVDVNPGGIVFEMAILSNKVNETFSKLVDMGFTAVECSENIVPISIEEKVMYVKMAKSHGLKVMFEVGEKYPEDVLDENLVAEEMNRLLEAGSDLLILERSLIEISLGEKGEKPEAESLIRLVENVGKEKIVFEAEAIPHQVWLFKQFGPDVNLGPNLEPNYIAKLEATRRTLSREGGYTWMFDKLNELGNS